MQQSTACLHFAWRTTSLRVGGRAASRSCRPDLRRGGGGRQAGATVLSCLVWRYELAFRNSLAYLLTYSLTTHKSTVVCLLSSTSLKSLLFDWFVCCTIVLSKLVLSPMSSCNIVAHLSDWRPLRRKIAIFNGFAQLRGVHIF